MSVEKAQILFPKPQLDRLRRIADGRDRPLSELVRAAVETCLERQGDPDPEVREAPPAANRCDSSSRHKRTRIGMTDSTGGVSRQRRVLMRSNCCASNPANYSMTT